MEAILSKQKNRYDTDILISSSKLYLILNLLCINQLHIMTIFCTFNILSIYMQLCYCQHTLNGIFCQDAQHIKWFQSIYYVHMSLNFTSLVLWTRAKINAIWKMYNMVHQFILNNANAKTFQLVDNSL